MKKQYVKFLERKLAKRNKQLKENFENLELEWGTEMGLMRETIESLETSSLRLAQYVAEKGTTIFQLNANISELNKIISDSKAENERQLKEIHQARNLIEANEILRAECKRLEGIIICNNGNG